MNFGPLQNEKSGVEGYSILAPPPAVPCQGTYADITAPVSVFGMKLVHILMIAAFSEPLGSPLQLGIGQPRRAKSYIRRNRSPTV